MENEHEKGSFYRYNTCKYRDMCLRYLGEEPIRWADVTSTPCPCNPAFFREVIAYSKVILDELENGSLPYTHVQLVKFMTEHRIPEKRRKIKVKELPLSQQRLPV